MTNDTFDMTVSPITHDKNGKARVFVRFTDGDRYAEGRIPGAKIVSCQGFNDAELAAIVTYMKQEKATILTMAKKLNVMEAFLGGNPFNHNIKNQRSSE